MAVEDRIDHRQHRRRSATGITARPDGGGSPLLRADTAHVAAQSSTIPAVDASPTVTAPVDDDASCLARLAAGESMLRMHAAELIQQMQEWAMELEARESQVNASAALQDARERQFRLWSSDERARIEELRRAAEARWRELSDAVRRHVIAELAQV